MPKVRVYDFDIPPGGYDLGGFKMSILVGRIKDGGAWGRIPPDMQRRIEAGETVVHKGDLDRLDEALWGWIAEMGGLAWHNEERPSPKPKPKPVPKKK